MDISAVSTLANSNNTSAVADKLKNNVKICHQTLQRTSSRAHLKILSLICGAGHKGNEGFHDTKE